MFRNYITVALRGLRKDRVHAFINISGLAVGMAVTILIGLWIWDECSFEKYNSHYDRIARVMQTGVVNGEYYTYSSLPVPLSDELRTSYGSAFTYVVPANWARDYVLSSGDKTITQRGRFMDTPAPDLLDLTMLEGTRQGLKDPSSILLSASSAKTIFGDGDAMGKTIKINGTMLVTVTGVYKDLPDNSMFGHLLFIAPWKLLLSSDRSLSDFKTDWGWDAAEIFVLLPDKADLGRVSARIRNSTYDHLKGDKERASYKPVVFLQPMSQWHLYGEFKNGVNTGGDIQFVWLFGLIGGFVLLLACINFMNLSTARSEKRSKEVGIRKVVGSARSQLIGLFFCESLASALIAFVFSLALVILCLPFFNEVAGKTISIAWTSPWFWTTGIGVTLFTGILAGSYPAFYLSSFLPIRVLKGGGKQKRAGFPRGVMVVLQFSVSIALIIGTLVVFRQVQYARNRPVGYDKEGLISIPIHTPDAITAKDVLREDLLKTGAVTAMAEASSPTTGIWMNFSGFNWEGKTPGMQAEFGAVSVTHDYGAATGWKIIAGRDFSRNFPTDSLGLIVNEAAVRYMGLKNPVGQTIRWDDKNYRIVGVIKDMIMDSPYDPVGQTIYYLSKANDANFVLIHMQPGIPVHEALDRIRSIFQKDVPSAPFSYQFVDEAYDKKFVTEERVGKLAAFFAILAVFISCMGIFGMASFMAEQRTKEIGIRKVLGASVLQLWGMLSGYFVLLTGVSLCIAAPIAWYAMHQWLQNYTYNPGIPWWIFVGTGVGALSITLATVSIQAIRAARMNPVKSLRSE